MELPFDTYSFRARFIPVVIVFLPLGLSLGRYLPTGTVTHDLLGGTLGAIAIAFLLSQIARDAGRKKQPELFHTWGGTPSVLMLGYRTTTLPPLFLKEVHQKLTQLSSSLIFPSGCEDEEADPSQYEPSFEAGSEMIRERLRDQKMVNKENISYGFRRNLWGMKRMAIALMLLSFSINGIQLWIDYKSDSSFSFPMFIPLIVNCILSTIWIFVVNPQWVKQMAFAYA